MISFYQSAYAQSDFIRFAIDKNAYDNFSDSQKNSLSIKIQELHSFIETKIKAKIPSDILENLSDLKIKISFSDKLGRDGLFIPSSTGEHTISIQLIQLNSNGIKALVAHEIYHAIHFHLNPDELPWVREGMAQLFEYITTDELNGMNLQAAVKNPLTPLLGDYDINEKNPAQYGHNMLYFYYLYNHCGKDNLFWKITEGKNQNELKGSFLIDAVLKEMNISSAQCEDFSVSAITFEVAKIHNQTQFLNLKNKDKYLVVPMEITPKFSIPKVQKEFEKIIKEMPVLSSFKLTAEDFKNFKLNLSNFEIFYANKSFPYTVNSEAPAVLKGIDVILVKLRKN
jgi:hypothetical protein